jgi:4-alpha-glucanotransferase
MLPEMARRGGAFIGLNPIHALYPANPESASPYSPSSRRWLNVIYIDVNAVDDFKNSKEAQAWWQLRRRSRHCRRRANGDVDYTAVTALKMAALRWRGKDFRVTMSRWRRSVSLCCGRRKPVLAGGV